METRIGPCLCGEPERVIEEDGKQILIRCPLYTKLQGNNPQTGNPVDEWACAIAWIPILLCENSKESRGTTASIESFRNEMLKQGNVVLGMTQRGEVKRLTEEM